MHFHCNSRPHGSLQWSRMTALVVSVRAFIAAQRTSGPCMSTVNASRSVSFEYNGSFQRSVH